MKTAIVQHEIRERDVEWTLQHIAGLMDEQSGADLYVLSEMFATGFMAEGAEDKAERVFAWMKEQAQRRNAAIAGSVAVSVKSEEWSVKSEERGERLLRNRLYFVRPDGSYELYFKRHTFTMGGEDKLVERGEKQLIVELNGWKIKPKRKTQLLPRLSHWKRMVIFTTASFGCVLTAVMNYTSSDTPLLWAARTNSWNAVINSCL